MNSFLTMCDRLEAQIRYRHLAVSMDHCIIVFGGKWYHKEPYSILTLWMYNLYTEEWGKHSISSEEITDQWGNAQHRYLAVLAVHSACAVAIGADIYLFGGRGWDHATNALLKLSRKQKGEFSWSCIESKSTPSPRYNHTGWEYTEKLWIFGGVGIHWDHFLNDFGDFTTAGVTNQLLRFDPYSKEWTTPICTGNIPEPRFGHSTTILRGTVWLTGGSDETTMRFGFDDLFNWKWILLFGQRCILVNQSHMEETQSL